LKSAIAFRGKQKHETSYRKTIRVKKSITHWSSSLEKDEVVRFEYNIIWEAVNQRSRDIWPMGGFLIGTALVSMASAAANLHLMEYPTIVVLAGISSAISMIWLLVFERVNDLNDECFSYLRQVEGEKRSVVGYAQSRMRDWAEKRSIGRCAVRKAFSIIVVSIAGAWCLLFLIKLFVLN